MGITLDEYHASVVNFLKRELSWLKNVYVYPDIKADFASPCAFLAVKDWEPADDSPADTQKKINLSCAIVVAVSCTTTDVQRVVRDAAMAVTVLVDDSRLGVVGDCARVLQAQPESFAPALEGYELWSVDFIHPIYVGASSYVGHEGAVPHKILSSCAPLIGLPNEPFYTELKSPGT
ncbi:hypothetical protein [Marinagarivorans algicola]|uniref:hypothetical protein n=1 Tax=Marinagarivorans algicola TaxID=1513270 RepID=UPI0006B666EC|nr:hypothetical protein [Marinagarivorans algicola]